MRRKTLVASLIALLLVTSAAAFGASGDKAKVKGMVTSRTGETLIVKSGGNIVTVVLTDDTKTQDKKGLFGLEKEQLSNAVLIPGLKGDVNGTSDDQGRVVAKTITVDGDDLETAQMIQSGLHPTAEQVAANVQTLETHHQAISGHSEQLAAQKQDIEANQQNIAANKQQIAENMKDIDENTQRFMALSDYDVKGEATVKFAVGSSKLSPEDQEQ